MKLFERTSIGNVQLRNRIGLAPMGMKCGPDGSFDQRNAEFYANVARGGVGVVFTGLSNVTSEFETRAANLLETFHHVSGLSLLCEKVHHEGAKVIAQIGPGLGRVAYSDPERPPYSASEIPTRANPNVKCRALSVEQIKKLVSYMARGAVFAKNAGCDGIELHSYGGYLIDQFLTAAWNKRTDEYGGDLQGRMRFLLEMIEAIRAACGPDFPIIAKITVDHCLPEVEGMRDLEEGLKIVKALEEAGIDAIHVDTGCYEKYYKQIPTVYDEPAYQMDNVKAVKELVSIPVIAHGKLNDPLIAEKYLQEGVVDVVLLGHQLLADPQWPVKVKEGRLREINHCIGCNECLFVSLLGRHRTCAINPMSGHEYDYQIIPAWEPKKVLVIGGGPGGIQAAIRASERGHHVELWEKTNSLGGNLIAAGAPDFKEDVKKYLSNLIHVLDKSNVTVRLNKEATAEEVIAGGYDNVVLATGSRCLVPPIPGVDSEKVITANEALAGEPLLEKVVVIGGGLVGCEAALHINKTAEQVTIVELLDDILKTVQHMYNNDQRLRAMIAESKIETLVNTKVLKITADGIEYEKDGELGKIDCDTVVLAAGYRSNKELEEQLWGKVKDLRVIGDAVAPRKVYDAVAEGFHYARVI